MLKRLSWILLLLPCALTSGASDAAPAIDESPQVVHSVGLDKLAVEIRRLLLNENVAAIRPLLKQLELSCRELKREDADRFGAQAVAYDQGLHRALDRTRELAAGGDLENAEKQYEWVLDACTGCHQATREEGLGPAAPLP